MQIRVPPYWKMLTCRAGSCSVNYSLWPKQMIWPIIWRSTIKIESAIYLTCIQEIADCHHQMCQRVLNIQKISVFGLAVISQWRLRGQLQYQSVRRTIRTLWRGHRVGRFRGRRSPPPRVSQYCNHYSLGCRRGSTVLDDWINIQAILPRTILEHVFQIKFITRVPVNRPAAKRWARLHHILFNSSHLYLHSPGSSSSAVRSTGDPRLFRCGSPYTPVARSTAQEWPWKSVCHVELPCSLPLSHPFVSAGGSGRLALFHLFDSSAAPPPTPPVNLPGRQNMCSTVLPMYLTYQTCCAVLIILTANIKQVKVCKSQGLWCCCWWWGAA